MGCGGGGRRAISGGIFEKRGREKEDGGRKEVKKREVRWKWLGGLKGGGREGMRMERGDWGRMGGWLI
jgi:hypothetical protein